MLKKKIKRGECEREGDIRERTLTEFSDNCFKYNREKKVEKISEIGSFSINLVSDEFKVVNEDN